MIDEYDGETESRTPLSGAEFVLKNQAGLFYSSDRKSDDSNHSGDKVTWLQAELNEETGAFTVPQGVARGAMVRTTVAENWNGKTGFEGIPAGVYYLYEIKAPEGYHRIKEPITIKIEPKELSQESGQATFQAAVNGGTPETIVNGPVPWGGDWDQLRLTTGVANHRGLQLPATGGPGVLPLYLAGGLLLACAAALLIQRRRSGVKTSMQKREADNRR